MAQGKIVSDVGMEHHSGVGRGKQLLKLRRVKVLSSTAIEWSEETWWKVGCEEGPLGKDSASAETAALSSFSRPSWRWDRRHPWARRQRAR
jgi:hypothetical protein